MRHLFAAAALVLSLPAAAQAQAWCGTGGLTATEAVICDDPVLSRLDRRMTRLYTREGSGYAGASLSQQRWLARRDACGTDARCIERAYRDRIAYLDIGDGDGGRAESEPPRNAMLRPWCDGRLNPTETTICATPRLADMDAALGAVYGQTKAADSDREQMRWLRGERDACGTDQVCIGTTYIERIVELGARLRGS
ncbi:hypothetical protein [Oceanicola sp. 22II-s10i]|uniref:hypothetical protein n=1 Tax=Oceanicola sp. 22II-s10i TaxID=1317116 RepID=UPI000B5274F2|nr:hypothetical protein [Oceanicola sp. 22II-s10i]